MKRNDTKGPRLTATYFNCQGKHCRSRSEATRGLQPQALRPLPQPSTHPRKHLYPQPPRPPHLTHTLSAHVHTHARTPQTSTRPLPHLSGHLYSWWSKRSFSSRISPQPSWHFVKRNMHRPSRCSFRSSCWRGHERQYAYSASTLAAACTHTLSHAHRPHAHRGQDLRGPTSTHTPTFMVWWQREQVTGRSMHRFCMWSSSSLNRMWVVHRQCCPARATPQGKEGGEGEEGGGGGGGGEGGGGGGGGEGGEGGRGGGTEADRNKGGPRVVRRATRPHTKHNSLHRGAAGTKGATSDATGTHTKVAQREHGGGTRGARAPYHAQAPVQPLST